MDTDIHYNIIGARFDEFSNFLFNHEVVPVPTNGSGGPEPWYWNASVTFDPVAVSTFYSQLFDSPEFLLDKFSHSQIEQGFWAIQSCNLACSVAEIIWHKHVNFAMRADCVRSMFNLYEKLFSHFPSETASEMWWDSLAYDWHCGNKARKNGGEEEQMQDVMFETLGKILSLSSASCQAHALHGLGHLNHPDTQLLIGRYLKKTKHIDKNLRDYALAASRFEVL